MTMARQRRRPHAVRTDIDIIAPERRGHVVHFRPVFSDKHIIDAEFEDIASEMAAAEKSTVAATERIDGARRPDLATGRRSFFGRMLRAAAAGPKARAKLFPLVLAGLCTVSFWVFGGHAVFAPLTGREASAESRSSVTSGISVRAGAVGGMRMELVDDQATSATPARQKVPAISLPAAARHAVVQPRPANAGLAASAPTGHAYPAVAEAPMPAVDVVFIDNGRQGAQAVRPPRADR